MKFLYGAALFQPRRIIRVREDISDHSNNKFQIRILAAYSDESPENRAPMSDVFPRMTTRNYPAFLKTTSNR